ncbi:MAG: hypothetical protein IMW97_02180 [Firmicutes bacterium]|nr:hypothetical protein [Candidatus Fermentithermobacillaceae bacterium]
MDREKLEAARLAYAAGNASGNDDFRVEDGPKSRDLLAKGITCYLDVFSYRQLLYLREAIKLLSNFDRLTRLNLALLVSTSLEFTLMLCGYKGVLCGDQGLSGILFPTTHIHSPQLLWRVIRFSSLLRRVL